MCIEDINRCSLPPTLGAIPFSSQRDPGAGPGHFGRGMASPDPLFASAALQVHASLLTWKKKSVVV